MQKMEEIRATGAPAPANKTENGQSVLQDRANRAPEPENSALSSGRKTPCPACTLVIDIDTNRCPHCSSEVSAHMALLRERAREQEDSRSLPKKIAGYITDPGARRDLRVVAPALILVLGLTATLRLAASPVVLWAAAPLSALAAHLVLKRAGIARPVRLDLYRTALLVGLAALLGGAIF